MASNVFLDTSGAFAFLVRNDETHRQARAIIHETARKGGRLITTDYIMDETATLLKARGFGHIVPNFFDGVVSSRACRVEWMDQDYFGKTKALFTKHADQEWSFTDCFSFVVMRSMGCKEALTKDAHFSQAGFVPLLG